MSEQLFILCQDDLGNYEIRYDDKVFHFLWEVTPILNEQQELIEELKVSDEMGWERAEHFEKKCPKELHNKKMYIKRLEYKVQKFKEENEQLRKELNAFKPVMFQDMRKGTVILYSKGCKNEYHR